MATIPRTYLTTSKTGLSNIPLRNGQVISIWDSDEVWYDAPINGQKEGTPVRRKISGIRVVSTLPAEPMEDIVYVYIGDHGTLPETGDPLYDMRVWDNGEWKVVGNNWEDIFVKSFIDDSGKFYLTGTSDDADGAITSLKKTTTVYVQGGDIYGNLEGNASSADYATDAGHAEEADKATKDNATNPKPITDYLYDVRSDAQSNLGSTITFTLGDETTEKSIRVSDTTYNVYTSSTDGLVMKTSETVNIDTTGLLLSGSGWIQSGKVTGLKADSATYDSSESKRIDSYVAGASYDTVNDELTLTYGDGSSSSPISIPNTTYAPFTTSSDGLAPAASDVGDTTRFLRGDGDWIDINQDVYNGTDRTPGFVPSSTAGVGLKFLADDGTWAGTFTEGTNGLVPAPALADDGKFLKYDGVSEQGVWVTAPDTLNTAGSTNDTTNKLYVIGATLQSASIATNSNQNVFIQGSRLYQYDSDHSAVAQVVDLTSTQALTNKTYEGMSLGSAAGKVATSYVSANDDVPTNNAVISYINTTVPSLIGSSVAAASTLAEPFDNTATYSVDDWCINTDAVGDQYLYRCKNAITTAGDFDPSDWDSYNVIEAIKYLIAHPS